jgi:hypothetical protein
VQISVTPGSHQITVKKKGFNDWTRKLNVSGGSIHVNADLETAAPAPAPTSAPAPAPASSPL